MATRSLVVFKNEHDNDLCVVYRQYDGHPRARGKELADFLEGRACVNGYESGERKQSNGIEDLAAQWIAEEKFQCGNGKWHVGNVYIMSPNTRGVMEEYIYTVRADGDRFSLTCEDTYECKYVDL
jgi:hypothetical protein